MKESFVENSRGKYFSNRIKENFFLKNERNKNYQHVLQRENIMIVIVQKFVHNNYFFEMI